LILKPIQPLSPKPGSSPGNTVRRTVQPCGDIDVLHPLGRVEHHPRPLHHPEWQRDRACPPFKLRPLFLGELDHLGARPGHNTYFYAPIIIPPNRPQNFRTRQLVAGIVTFFLHDSFAPYQGLEERLWAFVAQAWALVCATVLILEATLESGVLRVHEARMQRQALGERTAIGVDPA